MYKLVKSNLEIKGNQLILDPVKITLSPSNAYELYRVCSEFLDKPQDKSVVITEESYNSKVYFNVVKQADEITVLITCYNKNKPITRVSNETTRTIQSFVNQLKKLSE